MSPGTDPVAVSVTVPAKLFRLVIVMEEVPGDAVVTDTETGFASIE